MLNIAHRGASGYAPENTRAAFDRAVEMGADMIETDVQLTRDGAPVLFHDIRVDRTSDGRGPVADHTLAELRALDLGAWFSSGAFAGERVLTLAEFLTDVLPRIPAAIEIKDPRAAAATVAAINEHAAADRVHVTSFHWGALLDAQRLDDRLVLGFLTPVFDADIVGRCAGLGFRQVCPHVDTLTPELVAAAHDAGLTLRAWGITDRTQIDTLVAAGADGATVNWPDWLPDALASR